MTSLTATLTLVFTLALTLLCRPFKELQDGNPKHWSA